MNNDSQLQNFSPYRIHFFTQGKGGCSKSFIAFHVAEHQKILAKRPLIAIDADPLNPTLYRFKKTLKVERFDMTSRDDKNKIEIKIFDDFLERIINTESDFLLDYGASTFMEVMRYMDDNNVLPFLVNSAEHPTNPGLHRTVFVHVPVIGSNSYEENLDYLEYHFEVWPNTERFKIIIWINEFFGKVKDKHVIDSFLESNVYKKYKNRISGCIWVEKGNENTTLIDLQNMLSKGMTYGDVFTSPDFKIMEKQRLKNYGNKIFSQLDKVIIDPPSDDIGIFSED